LSLTTRKEPPFCQLASGIALAHTSETLLVVLLLGAESDWLAGLEVAVLSFAWAAAALATLSSCLARSVARRRSRVALRRAFAFEHAPQAMI
jgi:hypothetical protein